MFQTYIFVHPNYVCCAYFGQNFNLKLNIEILFYKNLIKLLRICICYPYVYTYAYMNLFCTKNSTHVNKHNQRHTIFDDRKAKKKKKKI